MIDHFLSFLFKSPPPNNFFNNFSSSPYHRFYSFYLDRNSPSQMDCEMECYEHKQTAFHRIPFYFFLFLFYFLHWMFLLLEIILHWFSLYILKTREMFWSRQVYLNPGSVLDRFTVLLNFFACCKVFFAIVFSSCLCRSDVPHSELLAALSLQALFFLPPVFKED